MLVKRNVAKLTSFANRVRSSDKPRHHRAPGHQLPSSRFQHRRALSAQKASPCSADSGVQPHDLDVPSASAATATWRTVPQEQRQPARRPVASRSTTSHAPNCCPMVTVMKLGGLGASSGCFGAWEAEGISRASWYRRRETTVSAVNLVNPASSIAPDFSATNPIEQRNR
jgi:hypothetical protein